jgi:hypothetical protein
VNFGDGTTISLNNPMAVQQRFQEVFPDALRAAVIKRKPEDLFCRDDGIMYGSGELWIHLVGQGEARHFAVATVNVPAGDRKVTAPATPVLFVCNADKHRIIVDMSSDGGVRYRSWNKPRSLADKADIVVAGGSADIEGTSVCAHSLWTFKKGKTTFLVSEPGCGEMPEGASGEIEVLVDEERRMQSWCY